MNIHKFNVKPKYDLHKTIKWLIPQDVKHPAEKVNTSMWKIFCQGDIVLLLTLTINFRHRFHDERGSRFSLPRSFIEGKTLQYTK